MYIQCYNLKISPPASSGKSSQFPAYDVDDRVSVTYINPTKYQNYVLFMFVS